jgi:hypothetical protein
MTIKQLGGVFGRNPTFSMVDIEGDGTAFNSLDVTGNVEIDDGRLRVLRTANTSYVQMEIDSTSAFIQSTYSSGGTSDLRFLHNSSEIMRITGNGITFNGDTAPANALDDYEEGSFAPLDNNIGAYDNGFGRYVKVGNMVNYSGQFDVQSNSSSSPADLYLPFDYGYFANASAMSSMLSTKTGNFFLKSSNDASQMGIVDEDENAQTLVSLVGETFRFNITYLTA